MTRRAWGEKNKSTLARMVRGFAASYEFMNDPKNRAEVTSAIKESLKVSDEVALEIFAPYLEPGKNFLPRKGELNLTHSIRCFNSWVKAGLSRHRFRTLSASST